MTRKQLDEFFSVEHLGFGLGWGCYISYGAGALFNPITLYFETIEDAVAVAGHWREWIEFGDKEEIK